MDDYRAGHLTVDIVLFDLDSDVIKFLSNSSMRKYQLIDRYSKLLR